MAVLKDQKYIETLLIEGYIRGTIFNAEAIDYPVDVTNSILLYYYEGYKVLPFDPNFKSDNIILSNDDKLATNPADSTKHGYILGCSKTEEAAWRLNVCQVAIDLSK